MLETAGAGTDPSAEQRLEGDASWSPDTNVDAGNGDDESIEATREANTTEATVVETRHGCGWGESSEGYEPRCGETSRRVTGCTPTRNGQCGEQEPPER